MELAVLLVFQQAWSDQRTNIGQIESIDQLVGDQATKMEAVATRLVAIASRLEAIASRLEAIASRLEAIASRLEAIAIMSCFPMFSLFFPLTLQGNWPGRCAKIVRIEIPQSLLPAHVMRQASFLAQVGRLLSSLGLEDYMGFFWELVWLDA